jgi:hypothetical protein
LDIEADMEAFGKVLVLVDELKLVGGLKDLGIAFCRVVGMTYEFVFI